MHVPKPSLITFIGLLVSLKYCHPTSQLHVPVHLREKDVGKPRHLDDGWNYSCPTTPGKIISFSPSSGTKIRLEIARSGTLCTLTMMRNGKESVPVPVGRSYNGHNWERVAGPFTSLQYEYDCYETSCEVIVPNGETSDQEFQLTTFTSDLPKRDEVARFLEQSTFGTTRKELEDLTEDINENENEDVLPTFVKWMNKQMFEINPTSHRKYYRKIVSPHYWLPGREGKQSNPCESGSRWRGYSFTKHDYGKELLISKIGNRYLLSIDGIPRTSVQRIVFKESTKFTYRNPENFKICGIQEKLYANFGIIFNGMCEFLEIGNPPVSVESFSSTPKFIFQIYGTKTVKKKASDGKVEIILLKKEIVHEACSSIPYPLNQNVYGKLSKSQYLIFEPSIRLSKNTINSPAIAGGGDVVLKTDGVSQCANAPSTFMNEKDCKLSKKVTSCAPYGSIDGTLQLNEVNILKFYELLQRPVYAITDLRLEDDLQVDSPCTAGERSRWRKVDNCTVNVKPSTSLLLASLLIKDENLNVKDMYMGDEDHCHVKDVKKRKLYIKVEGQCWMNTHPDNFSVYDFKRWAARHPGNNPSQNLIIGPADQGHHKLKFPSSHTLTRWKNNKGTLKHLGKLGDTLSIEDVPIWQLRDREVAKLFGFYVPEPEGQNIVVCGSPDEVANDALSIPTLKITQGPPYDALTDIEFSDQKKTVWTMIALNAEDQLRQRVAWVLSQILVISPSAVIPHNTETFLVYYDIFVRNAFGSYRDVLREVSYSPMMARMLSYHESRSSEYVWKKDGMIQFADENFAREVMQLFSIGLVQLNMDGTTKVDLFREPLATYTNEDITEYARAWTGFAQQGPRGNIEERERGNNSIDPMQIRVDWRDHYPKMGLNGKYIGDGYPLCLDLPQSIFLRQGAKWKLLGKSKNSGDQNLLRRNKMGVDIVVSVLDPSSALRRKLCNSKNGLCTFPSVVYLNKDLTCTGIECESNIKIVQLEVEGSTINYEFVRPPCVQFPFFNMGKKISKSRVDHNMRSICVDRHLTVAAEACCDNNLIATHSTCSYTGERVSYSDARSRCSNLGRHLCEYKSVLSTKCNDCCNYDGFFWTDIDCEAIAIIDTDGKVAIERPEDSVLSNSYESSTFFRVHWTRDEFPNPLQNCNNSACVISGKFCRCQLVVEEKSVFEALPYRNALLSSLHIGGIIPQSATTETFDDFMVHIADANEPYGMNTVFEVKDDFGRTLLLKNMESIVNVGEFSFRNTPSFFDAVPEVRDAQYETEAAIDHYFYHKNLAPFLAFRFAQRFGISNPSPGFIERVANAFKSGNSDLLPTTGRYGDLGAMIAAILTDRESRDVLLDSDSTHGALREPLLKVMSLMRNLDFQQTDGELTSLDNNLQDIIGQESHQMPSVFSFFLPEFAPSGEISSLSLLSPEAMSLSYTLGTIDGMISLIKYGLSRCFGGFSKKWCLREFHRREAKATGHHKYWLDEQSDDIADDLATMLTSGRMSEANRKIIRDAYFTERTPKKKYRALLVAQQLAIASPEFHVTGRTDTVGIDRRDLPPQVETCKKHKAVVHLLLKGGCDSFNMLVPHSKCNGTDLYSGYRSARGELAIPKKDLLKLEASTSSQQCKVFGLHPELPTLQRLYKDKDALFFAGIGVLTVPVTKHDFSKKTKTELFAHNRMQAEIGRLDPRGISIGTGVLGRLSDALHSKSYSVNLFSIDASPVMLQGEQLDSEKTAVTSTRGFKHFNPSDTKSNITRTIPLLNGKDGGHNGILSRFWSSSLHYSMQTNEQLYWAQKNAKLETKFPDSQLGKQLELVSKLLKSNECRGSERDIFYIENDGFDLHAKLTEGLNSKFIEMNKALHSFMKELKSGKKWDDVTIVVSSDFGRTLTPNSGKGSDHGWSGHSFILGGQVKGGRILGEYPTDLTDTSPLHVGRGRFIPTTPWESMWSGVAEWMGADDSNDLQHILPNQDAFAGMLFKGNDMFSQVVNSDANCDGVVDGEHVTCIPGDIPSEIKDDDFSDYYTSPEIDIETGVDTEANVESETGVDTEANVESETETKTDSSNMGPILIDIAKGKNSKTASIVVSIVAVVLTILFVATAVLYNKRTRRISKWLGNTFHDSRFRGETLPPKFYPLETRKEDKGDIEDIPRDTYYDNSIDLGKTASRFHPLEMEEKQGVYRYSDDNTDLNVSFESDLTLSLEADTVTLLHMRNGEGVEMSNNEVRFEGI